MERSEDEETWMDVSWEMAVLARDFLMDIQIWRPEMDPSLRGVPPPLLPLSRCWHLGRISAQPCLDRLSVA